MHWTEEPCFYVSVKSGERYGLLAGPFQTHQEALDTVDRATNEACEADPFAWFYAFGTCRTPHGRNDGRLNDKLGIVIDRTVTEPANG